MKIKHADTEKDYGIGYLGNYWEEKKEGKYVQQRNMFYFNTRYGGTSLKTDISFLLCTTFSRVALWSAANPG